MNEPNDKEDAEMFRWLLKHCVTVRPTPGMLDADKVFLHLESGTDFGGSYNMRRIIRGRMDPEKFGYIHTGLHSDVPSAFAGLLWASSSFNQNVHPPVDPVFDYGQSWYRSEPAPWWYRPWYVFLRLIGRI